MFAKSHIQTKLESEIISALDELENLESTSEEYGIVVDRIAKLHKLKSEEKTKLPNSETMLVVAANIFGILRLTRYEREHVISSKALGFVLRPR